MLIQQKRYCNLIDQVARNLSKIQNFRPELSTSLLHASTTVVSEFHKWSLIVRSFVLQIDRIEPSSALFAAWKLERGKVKSEARRLTAIHDKTWELGMVSYTGNRKTASHIDSRGSSRRPLLLLMRDIGTPSEPSSIPSCHF